MSRVKRGVTARARHKKIFAMAKGYRGRSKNVFRVAVMPTATEERRREASARCGFKESALPPDSMK